MILGVDIGNTNIVLSGIDNKSALFEERIVTDTQKSIDYYTDWVKSVMDTHGGEYEGAVVSSVVPKLTDVFLSIAEQLTETEPVSVSNKSVKLEIDMDYPEKIGADLLAAAAAAVDEYPAPMLIIDMGTATTVTLINRNRVYCGGMIISGVNLSLKTLTENTAQLPCVKAEQPSRIFAKNTVECMQSGVVHAHAAMIDGIIDRAEDELGEMPAVITTGGLSNIIAPLCRHRVIFDSDLIMKGLWIIYHQNRGGAGNA